MFIDTLRWINMVVQDESSCHLHNYSLPPHRHPESPISLIPRWRDAQRSCHTALPDDYHTCLYVRACVVMCFLPPQRNWLTTWHTKWSRRFKWHNAQGEHYSSSDTYRCCACTTRSSNVPSLFLIIKSRLACQCLPAKHHKRGGQAWLCLFYYLFTELMCDSLSVLVF